MSAATHSIGDEHAYPVATAVRALSTPGPGTTRQTPGPGGPCVCLRRVGRALLVPAAMYSIGPPAARARARASRTWSSWTPGAPKT
ncbi:hypothetical protein OG828_02115 [Streptomyces sp. NBC_00457]